jgi:bifunctional non-homologous end joining protein LigD
LSPRDLRQYRAKRDAARTPEPFGEERPAARLAADAPRRFVVQQHAARQLHWDLRLEIDGVLVSWAVPKGPSVDPEEKRLAVRTEDHPLEYADFEGIIPEGNYGAGAMIVWDCGVYRSVDGHSPQAGLEAGKLDLSLEGHKLRGRFALVQTRRGEGRDWLLFRKGRSLEEAEASAAMAPQSVLSGLTVAEVAAGTNRASELLEAMPKRGAPRRELPRDAYAPMLAIRGERPFSRAGWLFELKVDGVRALAVRRGRDVELRVRSGAERSALYPELITALRALPVDEFAIDGEIAAFDGRGRSSFERVQRRFTQTDPNAIADVVREAPVGFVAFDLLSACGRDLRGLPLVQRKELLSHFCPRVGVVRFADHVEGDGERLYEAAEKHGLEGIVAKRGASKYRSGVRSPDWQKLKIPRTARLVVGGIVPGKGSRSALGSLMCGWYRDDQLIYAGNIGSGLSEDAIRHVLTFADAHERDTSTFAELPSPLPRGTRHLEPQLVLEGRFTELTSAGVMRHPVFLRWLEDTPPEECLAPRTRDSGGGTASPPSEIAPAEPAPALTRVDKVFWPTEGYTKGDLLAYYEAIWPWLAPYLRDRPVVLTRYPDGIEGKHFYQKNAPEFTPDWVTRESIEGTDYFICNELRTLLYVINSGAIPLHVWSARRDRIDYPDWLILDLDPKEAPFAHVVEIARAAHRLLDELDTPHFVKTSGQDGLHVMLPLGERAELGHDEAKRLAEILARVLCSELPEIATVARPVAARGDKVYVDYLQNGRGKLIAAPFSVRPRSGAPVSTPLTWKQVTRRLDPTRWNVVRTPRQMAKNGDPMAGLLQCEVDVDALLDALATRLGEVEAQESQE